MKIRKLQLKNIGVFDEETIEFPPCPVKDKAEIHIFTGQNGSGKTTILQALAATFQNSGGLQQDAITERKFLNNWNLVVSKIASDDANAEEFLAPLLKLMESKIKKNETTLLGKSKSAFHKRFRFFEYDGQESFVYPEEDKFKSQVKVHLNDIDLVKIYANPTWWNSVLSHTSSDAINNYRNLLTVEGVPEKELDFGVFAFSGYRHIETEPIEALKEPKEFNPLSQSLEFIKDYDQSNQLTINQLTANNISKSAIEKGRNEKKSIKFANVIKSISQAISEITDWKIDFDLETEPTSLITKVNGKDLEFDVLPDGLRSLISWVADLLGRVDLLKWQDDLPIFEKKLILFLDEIEVHLHPAWQRKVLPVVQKLFKNSQIFVSTHSPFVVNSVDDVWVHKLKLRNGQAHCEKPIRSEDAWSYSYVLEEIFGIKEEFGVGVEKELDKFYELRDSILGNGSNENDIKKITKLAKDIAKQSEELNTIIQIEIRQINRKKSLNLKV